MSGHQRTLKMALDQRKGELSQAAKLPPESLPSWLCGFDPRRPLHHKEAVQRWCWVAVVTVSCQYGTTMALVVVDRLDGAGGARGGGEPRVGRDEDSVECLSERHVHSVPAAHRISELPRASEQ